MDFYHKSLGVLLIAALIYIIYLTNIKYPQGQSLRIDSTLTTITYDTVWRDTTFFKYLSVPIPQPYYRYDTIDSTFYTILLKDTHQFRSDLNKFYISPINTINRTYEDTITDDTLTIHYRAEVFGVLHDLSIGYKLLQPLHINATETIIKDKTGLYAGASVTGNASKLGLKYELMVIRKNIGYSGGYNIIDKTIEIGIKIKLR